MNLEFTSGILRKQAERCFHACRLCCEDGEEAVVMALHDAYLPMKLLMVQGEESPECKEIIEHLAHESLRRALKRFYERTPAEEANSFAQAFRSNLSTLIGEPL